MSKMSVSKASACSEGSNIQRGGAEVKSWKGCDISIPRTQQITVMRYPWSFFPWLVIHAHVYVWADTNPISQEAEQVVIPKKLHWGPKDFSTSKVQLSESKNIKDSL